MKLYCNKNKKTSSVRPGRKSNTCEFISNIRQLSVSNNNTTGTQSSEAQGTLPRTTCYAVARFSLLSWKHSERPDWVVALPACFPRFLSPRCIVMRLDEVLVIRFSVPCNRRRGWRMSNTHPDV